MARKISILGLMILILLGIANCSENEKFSVIDLSKTEDVKAESDDSKEGPLRIAIGGMIAPREGFIYYRRLFDYIEEKLGRTIEYIDREDYSEINELLKANRIDVAFVCGGPYVEGRKINSQELLVAPYAYGGTVYYSYVLAHKESPVETLEGLRGKTFAFTDPLSNTGKLVPTYMLAKIDETPASFFESHDYTYAHDKSIRAVAEGIVDGSAVDSLVWEYMKNTNPKFTSQTKIIKKSPPYGIPPVVVRPDLDEKMKEKLKQVFLNIHKDEKGREILKGMMVEKFVRIEDSAYDSIREMKQWLLRYKERIHEAGLTYEN